MKENKGPFQISDTDEGAECANVDDFRNYECEYYQTCLSLAAGLDWEDFSCAGCCGEIDEALLWQVRQVQRKDGLVKKLCNLPGATLHESDSDLQEKPVLKLVSSDKNAANES